MLAVKITSLSLFGIYCLVLLYRIYQAVKERREENAKENEKWERRFYF